MDRDDVKKSIIKIVNENGLNCEVSEILYRMYEFIQENKWLGACHACTSIIYVALCEIGLNPELCIGEVESNENYFDHSWIELNGKIIDIAICMTLQKEFMVSQPIIMNINIEDNNETSIKYGILWTGLDEEAEIVLNIPFTLYMDMYPNLTNGLWSIVEKILNKRVNINLLRKKYSTAKRVYKNKH